MHAHPLARIFLEYGDRKAPDIDHLQPPVSVCARGEQLDRVGEAYRRFAQHIEELAFGPLSHGHPDHESADQEPGRGVPVEFHHPGKVFFCGIPAYRRHGRSPSIRSTLQGTYRCRGVAARKSRWVFFVRELTFTPYATPRCTRPKPWGMSTCPFRTSGETSAPISAVPASVVTRTVSPSPIPRAAASSGWMASVQPRL